MANEVKPNKPITSGEQLSPMEYSVTRKEGTERAFTA